MKYKVGDKVRVKSLDWYNSNKEYYDNRVCGGNLYFVNNMTKYCGKEATIIEVINDFYHIDLDNKYWKWSDYMFEENMEERTIKVSLDKAREWYKVGGDLKEVALQAYSEKELKDKFPKTWRDCCDLIDCWDYVTNNSVPKGLGNSVDAFRKLLICREIYRRGWKPDWTDYSHKYGITYLNGKVNKEIIMHSAHVLSFKSAEVRNEFLKNYRDLIEQAKDLI